MRRATILSLALFSLLSLAGAAAAAEAPQPAAPAQTAATVTVDAAEAIAVTTPAAEVEAGLCSILEASRTNVLESVTAGYWCPPYTRYCQRNEQCSGYCGIGYDHWAVCSQGCCACLG